MKHPEKSPEISASSADRPLKTKVLDRGTQPTYFSMRATPESLFIQTFHILWLPALVLFANIVFEAGGIYYALPWIDMPMHFLGGASIGLAGIGFLALLQKQGFINTLPFLLHAFFVMSFVGLAAVSWELWEFSLDRVFGQSAQVDLPDTMVDMFLGLLGGSVTVVLWFVLHKRRN